MKFLNLSLFNWLYFLSLLKKFAFFLFIFLLPVFYLNFFSGIEISKVFLFDIFIIIFAFIWLFECFFKKEREIKRTNFDFLLFLFSLFLLLSSIFSLNKVQSFLGSEGNFQFSFIQFIFLIFFFYFSLNFIEKKDIHTILGIFLFSQNLVILFSFFQGLNLYLLPWLETRNPSFNLISRNLQEVAILAALGILISLIILFYTRSLLFKILISLSLILNLSFLYFFYNPFLNFILIICLFIISYFFSKNFLKLSPLLITTLVIFLLVVFSFSPPQKSFPLEVDLGYKLSLNLTLQALIHHPLLGVGGGNFSYLYLKYKPEFINQTSFWNTIFNHPKSLFLEYLSNFGIFTSLIFCIFLISVFVKNFFFIFSHFDPKHLLILSPLLFLFLSSFFLNFSFFTFLIFWLF